MKLEYIKEWCLTILNFMLQKNGNSSIIDETKNVVIENYNNKNIVGLKYCYTDINEWAKGLSSTDKRDLNNLLMREFGEDIKIYTEKENGKVFDILRNGKIANEDEYRLILNRIDEITEEKGRQTEIKKLNKLLSEYLSIGL